MGIQKKRLNKTVLLSTQNMFKHIDKKIIKILSLSGPMDFVAGQG